MALSDCFVSVVAPLANESAIAPSFVRDVLGILRDHYTNFELVLVDDGSSDGLPAALAPLLKEFPSIRVIRLSRRFGRDVAITAGLDTAIGDYVVSMIPEADPPAMIPDLVEDCRRGKDVLFGIRLNASQDPFFMRIAESLFYWFTRAILRVRIPEHATYFQVFSRQALNALNRIKEKYRYLRILSTYIGFENRTFTYQPIQRSGKKAKRSWGEAFSLALGLVTASSTNPLRFVSLMGLFASTLNGLYVVYIVLIYLFKPDVAPGWTTLSLQTAGLFFWVFLILTVLSEYIGHILSELKDRPLYYALEEKTSAILVADQERRNVVVESSSSSPAAAGGGPMKP